MLSTSSDGEHSIKYCYTMHPGTEYGGGIIDSSKPDHDSLPLSLVLPGLKSSFKLKDYKTDACKGSISTLVPYYLHSKTYVVLCLACFPLQIEPKNISKKVERTGLPLFQPSMLLS